MSAARDATTTLSREQREKFDRDGYLIIDDAGCPESVIDGIVADLDGRFEGGYRREADGVDYSWHRIMDAWKISANVRELALSPKVFAILEELYGRKPLPFQTLNFRWGTEQAAHSDTFHFNSVPPGYMCGVWVALEDIHPDCGPVVYYPGSHKLPEVTLEDVGPDAGDEGYTRYIAELIEREGLEPHYATIRKGEAFLWAANLLHGGSPRKDENRTRQSQVTHFFFEGCKYYTPRLTKNKDEVLWRHPEWITGESDAAREESARRMREIVADTVPDRATVLVVSKNDNRLLELGDRRGWHFPQDESGAWAGYYPADSDEAIEEVEKLRAKGAEYLVFPDAALWWLEYYSELGQHLEQSYPTVAREQDCLIFELCSPTTNR